MQGARIARFAASDLNPCSIGQFPRFHVSFGKFGTSPHQLKVLDGVLRVSACVVNVVLR